MPNKNYIKGRRFEYQIRDNLRSAGYYVLRSAGSHSKIDLLALNGDKVLCLQLKKNCRPDKKEYNEFYDINVPINAFKIIVIKTTNGFEINYIGKEPDITGKMDLFSDITGREVFI